MARGISVYQLRDPRTEQVRYIGYSRDPRRRLRGHLTDQSDTHKVRWIRLLLERNLKPQLGIICVMATYAEAKRIEIALIAWHRKLGTPLTNETDGGDGARLFGVRNGMFKKVGRLNPFFGKAHTEETKAIIRQRRTEQHFSEDTRRKLSDAARGKNNSFFGMSHTEATRRRLSEARRGSRANDAARHKMRKSGRRWWANASQVERHARLAAMQATARLPKSAEHRHHLSIAAKQRVVREKGVALNG